MTHPSASGFHCATAVLQNVTMFGAAVRLFVSVITLKS